MIKDHLGLELQLMPSRHALNLARWNETAGERGEAQKTRYVQEDANAMGYDNDHKPGHTCRGHHALKCLSSLGQNRCRQPLPTGQ